MITIGDIVCRTENDYSDEENCKIRIRVNADVGIIQSIHEASSALFWSPGKRHIVIVIAL